MARHQSSSQYWILAIGALVALALFVPTSEIPKSAVAATLEGDVTEHVSIDPAYEERYTILEKAVWDLEYENLCDETPPHLIDECRKKRIPLKNETYALMDRIVQKPHANNLDADLESFFKKLKEYMDTYFLHEQQ